MSRGDHAVRHVCFLTGTRADYGKLKPLIRGAASLDTVRVTVVATGMHLLERYGSTVIEVRRLQPDVRVVEFPNQTERDSGAETLERILANTVAGLADLIDRDRPDLLVVHGDRVEALAGASAGALRNVAVAHVEGGELSGTIDGILRHAVSKLSHLHLVANDEAARRVIQLGEDPDTVFVIGSPDIDIMLSEDLPPLPQVLADYEIPFEDYSLVLFHGVTSEPVEAIRSAAEALIAALRRFGGNAVVVYPNNDPGSEQILHAYGAFAGDQRVRVFPSVRFEAFLTLLRHSRMLVGNSSAGVREAPIYGVPSVNIGNRQRGRHRHPTIIDAEPSEDEILNALRQASAMGRADTHLHWGTGRSAECFRELLAGDRIWRLGDDKVFRDLVFHED